MRRILHCVITFSLLKPAFALSSEALDKSSIPLAYQRQHEIIYASKDDNGFAPLKTQSHYKLGQLKRGDYIDVMRDALTYALKGHTVALGLHLPYWSICFHPLVEIEKNKISLYVLNDRLQNEGLIGTISFDKIDSSVVDQFDKLINFIEIFKGAEKVTLSHQQQLALTAQETSPVWSTIDHYLVSQFAASLPPTVHASHAKGAPCDEVLRLIGEYFRWRKEIVAFCQEYIGAKRSFVTLEHDFLKFLIGKGKLPKEQAEHHAKVMNVPTLYQGVLLKTPGHLTPDDITIIFNEFMKAGLMPTEALKNSYREQLFPT